MVVDQYAHCPCGSGKKIKFCKCASSIDELDRVAKMVSGGQVVAALDRLNQVLEQHPDAAWALALKGRLLISLEEHDSLAANCERFLRLQPSNPLALCQQSTCSLMGGDLAKATEFLLKAFGESGREVDTMLLDVSSMVASMQARIGNLLTARLFATLPLSVDNGRASEVAINILRSMSMDRSVSLLLKALPTPLDRPDDASWGERFDEAESLLQNNQVLLAESKFEALDRQFSDQPSIVSGLLMCAIWRGDRAAQGRLLRKLARIVASDVEQAARYLAIGSLVDPEQSPLRSESYDIVYEVNADEAIVAMTSDRHFDALPPQYAAQVQMEGEEVPPKAVFEVFDKPRPEAGETPKFEDVPEVVGLALVYGRQTDREPRLKVWGVAQAHFATVQNLLKDVLRVEEPKEKNATPQLVINGFIPRLSSEVEEMDPVVIRAAIAESLPGRVVKCALPAFEGKTIGELCDDPSTLVARTALCRMVQSLDNSLGTGQRGIQLLNERLGVKTLPAIQPTSDEELEELSTFDLLRVDASGLDIDGLEYLLHRCVQVNCVPQAIAAAQLIVDYTGEGVEIDTLTDAYLALVERSESAEAGLKLCQEARERLGGKGASMGEFALVELQLYLRAQDPQGFQRTADRIMREHGNEPEIMYQFQQLLIRIGLINPDGSPRQPRAMAQPPVASSGLWTGDAGSQGPPPPAGSSPGAAKEGGSKLWIPGMD